MSMYVASISPAVPGTTNDVLTFTAPANRRSLIHEVSATGLGTSSAANELCMFRPVALGITPTALSPAPVNTDVDGVVMAGTVASGWVTQPDITAVAALMRLGCNSNGGAYRWVAKPGTEISYRHNVTAITSQLSLRFVLGGAQKIGIHVFFEER